MSTRRAEQLSFAALLALAGCGQPVGDHYHGEKNYGQSTSQSGDALPVDPVIPVDSNTAVAPPTTPSPGSPADQAGGDSGVEVDTATDEAVKVDPDSFIRKEFFRATFDQDSARGINDNSGYRALGAIAGPKIKDNLVTQVTDGLTVAQTFGDGQAHSLVTQDLVNSAGDANRTQGAPSTSGTRRLDRIVAPGDCPSVFLCIQRMVITPKEGDAKTVCFHDADGKMKPFPYGVLPNYKAADFTTKLGDYGPFTVTAYAGADVDCAKTDGKTPLATEQVKVTAASVDTASIPVFLQTVEPPAAQYAVSLTTARVQNDLVAPYIDETVLLNGKTTYVMNETMSDFVKLIVTTRQSVDIAQSSGGGIIGKIAGLLVNLDGVTVDLHLELCKNLLDPKTVDHCPTGGGKP